MRTSRTVAQELAEALAHNRQPNCPYCQQPLVVEQTQTEFTRWAWDELKQRYVKDDADGRADAPFCAACGQSDPDFLSASSAVYDLCERLGLEY